MIETLRKCYHMLPPESRRRWLLLAPLATVTGLAETGAAAGIFALITVLSDPSHGRSVPWIAAIIRVLPYQGQSAVILELTALLAVYYIAKNLLVLCAHYYRIRVSHSACAGLASGMLRRYLAAPYPFHFRRNSAELIRNCTSSIGLVLGGVLGGAVYLVTDALMALGVVAVLLATSPGLSLIAGGGLAVVVWTVLHFTRNAAERHGTESHELTAAILQSLQQAFGGIKEVKVLGRERFFIGEFEERQRQILTLGYLGATLSNVPVLAIQTLLVCGALALIAGLTLTGRTGLETLPVAGVFSYAGLRILPMTNSFVATLNTIRSGGTVVDELYDDYVALAAAESRKEDHPLEFREAIALTGVSYRYPEQETFAVQDITLTIRRGESIGIVGPTGAGKSTLVDLILGLLPPTTGTITVDGVDLGQAVSPWKRRVGYVPQTLFLIDDTLRRNIALGVHDAEIDDARVRSVVETAQLHDFIAALPDGLDSTVGERGVRLSGGERQRIAIARALYHDPDVIVFDEATSSLDLVTEAEVNRTIGALRGLKTMVVIAHRLSSVKACDRLVWIRKGRVAGLGSWDELCATNSEFRSMTQLAAV